MARLNWFCIGGLTVLALIGALSRVYKYVPGALAMIAVLVVMDVAAAHDRRKKPDA